MERAQVAEPERDEAQAGEDADYGESSPVDDAGAREELAAARAFVEQVAGSMPAGK